jgi:tetratricopeptide (TPR) repeat protein
MKSGPRPSRPLPLRRRLAFLAVLAIGVPAVLLLLAEAAVRMLVPEPADDPFLTLVSPASVFERRTLEGQEYYVVTHRETYSDRATRVPVAKPAGALRVFGVGGSAAAGWPHPAGESYADHLRAMLAAALAPRAVEVHNVAGHGFASYRVRRIFDEILELAPDLVIVYSGNNEFVERRTYLHETGVVAAAEALARRSRLARLLSDWARRRLVPGSALSGAGNDHLDYHLWAHIEQVASELRSDPAQLARVEQHYAHSMQYMADRARARGVPIVFLTVPVNLRDWHPHVSKNSRQGAELEDWRQKYRAGRRALLEGRHDDAAAALAAASRVDPQHAETWFWLGRALLAQEHPAAALDAFTRAKDSDFNPFRALSAFNATLRNLGGSGPGVAVVDMERVLAARADRGVPGFDLFLDYVHPTRRGNLLLAAEVLPVVLQALANAHGARARPAAEVVAEYRPRPYDEDANLAMQCVLLSLFRMMHQYEGFVAKARAVLAAAPDSEQAVPRALIEALAERFTLYLDEQRKDLSGQPFDPDYEAALRTFYRESFGLTADGKLRAAPAAGGGPR